MFFYWAYGLEIVSELEFPEMYPYAVKKPDLEIKFGKVPAMLTGPEVIAKEKFFISPTEYLIHLPICSYYVKEGASITIELKENADLPSVRLFLLTNAMAAVLHQRNKVALHAGAIQTEKGLVVICGESGAGKSTTISALQQRGYKIFVDDVLVLEKDKDNVVGVAAYPTLKLWDDSFSKIGIENSSENFKLRESIQKFGISFKSQFNTEPRLIYKIINLKKGNNKTTGFSVLKGVEAFQVLFQNQYSTSQISSRTKAMTAFQILNKLIKEKMIYQIIRPNDSESLEEVQRIAIGIINE